MSSWLRYFRCIGRTSRALAKSMFFLHTFTCVCVRKFPFTVLTIAFSFFPLPRPVLPVPPTPDLECNSDDDCPNEKACINLHCMNPCSLRGACGENALCRPALHRPRCSCPQCYVGSPGVACRSDPRCDTGELASSELPAISCERDADCPSNMACERALGECYDPCRRGFPSCRGNKRCAVRNHRPACVCRSGFVVNERGELTCAPSGLECARDAQCATNRACVRGRCVNPCASGTCAANKTCEVLDHRPVCICMRDCTPSLSICLRDSGCPPQQACRNYRCEDPCAKAACAADAPCYVEDHRPVCKFCPPGFVVDRRYGCLKGKDNSQILCQPSTTTTSSSSVMTRPKVVPVNKIKK